MISGDVYVMGCGGHGRVVLDALLCQGVRVTGILDPSLQQGEEIFGIPVLGGDDYLEPSPGGARIVNGLGANPDIGPRKELFLFWRDRGLDFLPLAHPSAVVARDVVLARGCQVFAGSVLQSGVRLGDNVVINTRASVDHDCAL